MKIVYTHTLVLKLEEEENKINKREWRKNNVKSWVKLGNLKNLQTRSPNPQTGSLNHIALVKNSSLPVLSDVSA